MLIAWPPLRRDSLHPCQLTDTQTPPSHDTHANQVWLDDTNEASSEQQYMSQPPHDVKIT